MYSFFSPAIIFVTNWVGPPVKRSSASVFTCPSLITVLNRRQTKRRVFEPTCPAPSNSSLHCWPFTIGQSYPRQPVIFRHLCAVCLTESVWNHRFNLPYDHGIDDSDLINFATYDLSEDAVDDAAQRTRILFTGSKAHMLKN